MAHPHPNSDLLDVIHQSVRTLTEALSSWQRQPSTSRPTTPRSTAVASASSVAAESGTRPGPGTASSFASSGPALPPPGQRQRQVCDRAGVTSNTSNSTNTSLREFRQLFGLSGRGASTSAASTGPGRGRGSSSRHRPRSSSACPTTGRISGSFLKDVILLDYKDDTVETKLRQTEAGRVSSSVSFYKGMDEREVESIIEELFADELQDLPRPRFEYVKVLSRKVTVPHTRQSHTWNGAAIRHLAGQGDLYVRATAPIVRSVPMESSDEELPDVFLDTTSSTAPSSTRVSAPSSTRVSAPSSTRVSAPSSTLVSAPLSGNNASYTSRTYQEYINLLECDDIEDEQATEDQSPLLVGNYKPINLEDTIMKMCLESWKSSQVDDENKTPASRITLRRSHILQDVIRAYKGTNIHPKAALSVYFIGESGVDEGGLTRELASLLLPLIRDSSYLCGPPGKMVPSTLTSTSRLINGEMRALGKILGAIVLHARQSVSFLNPMLAEIVLKDSATECTWAIDLIPDDGKRASVQKIHDATTDDELTTALDACTIVDDLCWTKIINIDNKAEVVRAATIQYTYYTNKAAIDEMLLGLNFYGAKDFARKNPDCFRSLFGRQETKPLDANTVFDLFQPIYSLAGSNARSEEEATTMFFIEFLQKCGTADPEVEGLTLEDFLQFFCGARCIPLGGFDMVPTIKFHNNMLPHVSTCSLELQINRKCAGAEAFIKDMVFGLKNAPGFGQV
ncbi:uncharacterized protein LOC135154678 [Lytechinus pictus]|uniref:uncharacterized protein LOC135154678 n=1 Tax=Lytechinus pictus TaxID=7653 RepID=UPI0030BA190E